MSEKTPIPIGPKGVELNDIDSMYRFATCYLQSGLAPKSFQNAEQLVIAWAKAAELGLSPLQASEGMSIISGKLGIMGDLALALVEASGQLQDKKVTYTGEGPTLTCEVMLKRKDRKEQFYSWSVREAKEANIYDRSPTWKGYPKRMTYYRALGFGLRDEFSDILKGMKTVEELQDYPTDANAREATRDAEVVVKEKLRKDPAVKFVETPKKPAPRPTAAEEVAPAFPEDAQKEAPAFSRKLESESLFPKEEPDDINLEPPPQAQPAAAETPEETAAAPAPNPTPEPEPEPAWKNHVIRGIPKSVGKGQFYEKKIGDLTPALMAIIENQWLPAIREQWEDASEAQRTDAPMFEQAIAFYKMAKPW